MRISRKIAALEESPTMAVMARAKALKDAGKDIVGFTVGEPDFDTPDNIKDAAHRAIDEGKTKYTPVGGVPELKDAVIAKLKRDNGLDYKRNEILISCGGKHSIFNMFLACLNPGDEVIIPSPYWVSYPPMVELAGGVPVIVDTNDVGGFKMTVDAFLSAVTPRTRMVVINSPSNPTGAAYTRAELEALVAAALSRGLLIASDEIYEKLVYDGFEFVSPASFSKEAQESTIVLNGVSKTYAMTGWRIGYAAAPADIIECMTKVQGQSTSNPASISQWAAVEALNGPQRDVERMIREFSMRRALMIERLNNIDGVSALMPEGAFYSFPNLSSYYGKAFEGRVVGGSADMAEYLLDGVGLAVVPGVAFGSDANIRLSYACSVETIEEGLARMALALQRLS